MPTPDTPLPTFLIIGAQKSATRWLRHNLGMHPEVFTADYELAFFNRSRYQKLGTDWYREQFAGWSGEPFVGEATPGYMIWHHSPGRVANRISETIPDVKLIAILRNPVDRANSAMVHHKRRERIRPNARLLDLVRAQPPEDDGFGLITGGWYAASLRPFARQFGDQLLVVLHDDVVDDPRAVYERALRHIGAATDFVPPELEEVVFSNQMTTQRRQEIDPEDRLELYEFFRDDIRKLERMFDLDLSLWKPDRPSSVGRASKPYVLLDTYDAANAWIQRVVDNVAADQHGDSTNDPEVSVRMLLDRLVASALYCSVVLRRTELGDPRTPAERANAASDPASGYRQAAAMLRESLAAEGSFEGTLEIAAGRPSAANFARSAVVLQLATGWEIAVSTAQDARLPAELADPMVDLARDVLAWKLEKPDDAMNEATTNDPRRLQERFLASIDSDAERSRP